MSFKNNISAFPLDLCKYRRFFPSFTHFRLVHLGIDIKIFWFSFRTGWNMVLITRISTESQPQFFFYMIPEKRKGTMTHSIKTCLLGQVCKGLDTTKIKHVVGNGTLWVRSRRLVNIVQWFCIILYGETQETSSTIKRCDLRMKSKLRWKQKPNTNQEAHLTINQQVHVPLNNEMFVFQNLCAFI